MSWQRKKNKKGIFEQLFYQDKKIEVMGLAKVGTADAYKIQITDANGKKETAYYDVTSGLLVKEEKTAQLNGTDITQIAEYSDYRKVGAILLPYKINQSVITAMGNQDFSITIKDIKINSDVKATDFN
jgi:zinc protease